MDSNPFQDQDDVDLQDEDTQESPELPDALDITTPVDESQEIDETPALNFEVPEVDDSLKEFSPEATDPPEFPEAPDIEAPEVDQDFPPNQFDQSDAGDDLPEEDLEAPDAPDDLDDIDTEEPDSADELPELLAEQSDAEELPELDSPEESESPDSPDGPSFSTQSISPLPNLNFSESPSRSIPGTGYKTAGTFYGY